MNSNQEKQECCSKSAPSAEELSRHLSELESRIGETYRDGVGVNPVDGENLPRRAEVVAITGKLGEVTFPGVDGRS